MLLYLAVVFYILAFAYNIKLIIKFISCRGKEPPFISSFGQIKKEIIAEASDFLSKNPKISVTDLGCGTGCLLIPLAKKFSECKFVGYEYDVLPYLIAKIKTFYLPNVFIYKRNFFKENLSEYKLALCYITPGIADILADKINKEMPQNALIISEIFEMAKLRKLTELDSFLAFKPLKIFVYNPIK